VSGGTRFIGRWLLVEPTRREQTVAVLLRPPMARFAALQAWVSQRGGNDEQLVAAPGDLDAAGLGLDEATDEALAGIRDVFSLAGRFEFGLDERQARRANVDAPLHLARWATGRPGLRRFVHVSEGMTLARRVASADGELMTFAGDLAHNLDLVDRFFEERFRATIDTYVDRAAIEVPSADQVTVDYQPQGLTELNLAREGISTIIWE
jgi:thioester reductase-like protein